MSTEHMGSDHANAIETARVAYVTAIRDGRTDAEIKVLRQALKQTVSAATVEAAERLAGCSHRSTPRSATRDSTAARARLEHGAANLAVRFLALLINARDVLEVVGLHAVNARDVVDILIVSIRATLISALALRGLSMDSITIEELAQELAKNSAQGLLGLEIAGDETRAAENPGAVAFGKIRDVLAGDTSDASAIVLEIEKIIATTMQA